MQEIVDEAISLGLGADEQTITRLALVEWWGDLVIESAGRENVQRMLEQAAADTRPGLDPDEVFARLENEWNALIQETAHAA